MERTPNTIWEDISQQVRAVDEVQRRVDKLQGEDRVKEEARLRELRSCLYDLLTLIDG